MTLSSDSSTVFTISVGLDMLIDLALPFPQVQHEHNNSNFMCFYEG